MFGARVHRCIFLALLALLAVFMTTSVFMANMMWVLLFANWVFEGRWRAKWQMARESRLLHVVVALMAMLALSMLWSDNWHYGLFDLQKKLPLLALPLVLLTTEPLQTTKLKISILTFSERQLVAFFYVGTVFVVTMISIVRMMVMPDLPYRDIVPYISHIRLALNICLAVCILVSGVVSTCSAKLPAPSRDWRSNFSIFNFYFSILLIVWFAVFLLVIRSYTAIVILAIVATVILVAFWSRMGRLRWWMAAVWAAVVLAAGGLTVKYVHDYYAPVPLVNQPLAATTAGGRPYLHLHDGMTENGNLLNNYICNDEIFAEWPRRSDVPLNHLFDNGYELYPTLLRYLNAVGLTKDSVGIWSLTPDQVADIERGVANPVYETFGLRRMVYVMLFERENYIHFGVVRDFTMLQRFELWKTALRVIGNHPWFGVGNGDVPDALHAQLEADGSELAGTTKNPHCQYITIVMAIGVIGAVLLLLLMIRALLPGGRLAPQLRDPLTVAYITIILVSFCSEDTLETLAGILFCCFYLAFRKTPSCTNTTN